VGCSPPRYDGDVAVASRLRRLAVGTTLAVMLSGFAACGASDAGGRLDSAARIVALPGAARGIDFDDIVYSARLGRVLVPARASGLYSIDPRTDHAARLGRLRAADSVDEGRGLVFVGEREQQTIDVLDPRSGKVVESIATAAPPDYVRYVTAAGQLWVTEPAASPSGIEIFALPADRAAPRRVGFVPVPGGPEGLTWSDRTGSAYTHAGPDLVRVDLASRQVNARWATGCDGTHGFPRVDERQGFLLASCTDAGKVVLMDLETGRRLGSYSVGGGEALPAYSPSAQHFYVRSDPGDALATLAPSRRGLRLVSNVRVPSVGHCLTADSVGHYWTCDADQGRILGFDDP
jgi:hypothetical protein